MLPVAVAVAGLLVLAVEWRGDVEDGGVEAAGERGAEVVELDLLGVDLED
jgi:hypothetical protein